MHKNTHTITVHQPTNLADCLRSQRIPVRMSCGGHGSCTSCRVLLDGESVLSCQHHAEPGEYTLEIPLTSAGATDIQMEQASLEDAIPASGDRWRTVTVNVPSAESQPVRSNRERMEDALEGIPLTLAPSVWEHLSSGDVQGDIHLALFDQTALFAAIDTPSLAGYAVAVDVGTTTIAVALVDLSQRAVVDCRGRLNAQYAYAEDLLSRISYCTTRERRLEMRDLVLRGALAPLVWRLLRESGLSAEQVVTTVVSGNAPMIHLLLALDPTGMGGWPFNGVDYAPPARTAAELKLPGRHVEFIPAQSAYFGGDVMSGLAWLDFENAPDGSVMVDLGTNAEMAVKVGDRLLCTAVPAGPSFEGGGLSCGVGAVPGAVDHVWEERDRLAFSTIGDRPAIGLCGSGVVSFVAAAFRAGVLQETGRFSPEHEHVAATDILGRKQLVYQIAKEVYVSEEDISCFLQAKAAVFSGLSTLCEVAGVDVFDAERFYLAGNFGRYVAFDDMVAIGMAPPLAEIQVTVCGNASLKGAVAACLDPTMRERLARLSQRLEFIDLNGQDSFQDEFIDALFLPHLSRDFKVR